VKDPARAIEYQPALDGLRAVAVCSVMAYHAGVAGVRGGFLGVDVFFVLSGYLITSLLWKEARTRGRVEVFAFWGRRFRRLLPAFLVVVATVAAFASAFATPERMDRLRADGISALLYVSNWHFILGEQSYFDAFAAPSPFLHTWSLGIEEQWYLLWPLTLWGLFRLTRGSPRRLALAAAGAAVASALWMAWIYEPGLDPSRVYYGTDTRAQNLLIGSALAFALPGLARAPQADAWIAGSGWIGATALLGLLLLAEDQAPWLYRGGLFGSALATAAVIATSVQPGGAIRRLLSLGPMRFVGRISYGMYLWHWPLFLLFTPERTGLEGAPLLGLQVAATVGVSTLSFQLLESPIRRGAIPGARAAGLALAGIAGAVALLTATTRIPEAVEPIPAHAEATSEPIDPDAADRIRIVILGDSVASSLASGFSVVKYHRSIELLDHSTYGCGVGRGSYAYADRVYPTGRSCQKWPARWHLAEALTADRVIVLIGAWEVVDRIVDGTRYAVHSDAFAELIQRELARGLGPILERGIPVTLLTTPCFAQRWGQASALRLAPRAERNDPARVIWLNEVLAGFAEAHPGQVEVVDLHGFTCDAEGLPGTIDGTPLQPDGVHFDRQGGQKVWSWLLPQVAPGV
jgi:peptidoglycan/LPS O-acetylase OafA/YrhL